MPSTITLPIFSKWCHISFEREMKSWMIYCAKVFPILLWYEQWLTGPHFGWLSSPYVLARKTTMSKTNSEKRRMNKIETLLTLARLLTCYVSTQMEINYVFRFSNCPLFLKGPLPYQNTLWRLYSGTVKTWWLGNKMDPGSFEFLFKDFLKKKT